MVEPFETWSARFKADLAASKDKGTGGNGAAGEPQTGVGETPQSPSATQPEPESVRNGATPEAMAWADRTIQIEEWRLEVEGMARELKRQVPALNRDELIQEVMRRTTAGEWAPSSRWEIGERERLKLVTQSISPLFALEVAERNGWHAPKDDPIDAMRLDQLYKVIDDWDSRPWVWEGILPHNGLSLLVGKSESGKSTLVYSLIYAIVTGSDLFGRQCEKGRVIYLAGDPMSQIVAGKTFRSLGLTDGVTVVSGALVMNPTGLQQVRRLAERERPSLVVADTLAATVDIDVDKYGQSYKAQQPLSDLAKVLSPNVLMCHHSQKAAIATYGVIDAALGSVGVAAVAGTRMVTRDYRRRGKKYFTFQMSNLRIGQPLEGEYIVVKQDSGLVELGGSWRVETLNLDKANILKALAARGPMTKRTLWSETFPKPQWAPFNEALDELFANQEITIETGPRRAQIIGLK